MKRIVLAAAGLLALAACGPQQGADDYSFEHKETDRREVALTVVEHPSLDALRDEAARRHVRAERRDLMAFSVIIGARCEMHIVDPAQNYEPEWIGHELVHCLHGRWHG